jgi:arginyl-tRNA synthetase
MQEQIKSLIKNVISTTLNIEVEIPKNEAWGDYSTNIAIISAKTNKSNPKELADKMVEQIKKHSNNNIFTAIESTPQGFINFKLDRRTLEQYLFIIMKADNKYGFQNISKGKRVLIEFVSANPTGPLHIGHGRWAVIGDSIANLLKSIGYKVDKEYYVNDAGEQIDKLVRSVVARIENKEIPEDGYAGSYVYELASKLKGNKNIKSAVLKDIISQQKKTLSVIMGHFDKWFYESDLHKNGSINKCIGLLKDKGLTFNEGPTLWFKSSEYGDDKNRVLIKEDGQPTYFSADIAYHANKFNRGYYKLINVWGTDHHGYVARLKAAMTALGYPAEKLEIIIGQLVALYRGKELVRMSKRTGEMITLKEVIDEIGSDATRYFLAKNSPNTHLDFDLELAKSKSLENPVYYVQYAHARICSILKEAEKVRLRPSFKADLSLLTADEERKLMLKLVRYEDEVANAAMTLQPHKLTAYSESLAQLFHNYYHKYRIISDDLDLSRARLTLVKSTSIVLRNVLKLLGISAPQHM